MHRTFEISAGSPYTQPLIRQLQPLPDVIGLSVQPGGSIKPPGDIITLHILNRGADEILRRVADVCGDSIYTIVTSEHASLIDRQNSDAIENDVDEAIWEEVETGLRHNGHITSNYLTLMAIGGIIGAVGLVSDPAPQAVAFVAAAVIAPGFDPLAKLSLGLLLGKKKLLWLGLKSSFWGYGLLIVMAALAYWLMEMTGAVSTVDFTSNPEVKNLVSPSSREYLMSVCGAIAGAVMIAAYRESFISGALMALAFIHAAAMIGVGIVSGEYFYAWQGAERLALDMALIVGGCWLVFFIKQHTVHNRKPIM